MPFRGPPSHVPCATPSRAVASPRHFGQGLVAPSPLWTDERSRTSDAPSPAFVPLVATFTVPVKVPSNLLMTQTGTPPDDSGSGGP